ncbi:MAG: site-specific DNA-methyltransferase [Pirellulales bacterium]
MAKKASTRKTTTKKAAAGKTVETLTHDEAKRKNIPTAEYQSVVTKEHAKPVKVKYPRNTDLDPQLVWRGKDEQDWSDLVVHAPPLYIQEKVHPKVLIDDLLRQSQAAKEAAERAAGVAQQLDLFADFNGVPEGDAKTEFYQHDQNWSNRMILGDSLQVMASLAEREGLRGKVQCIYLDPPYGIKFNSNFQWSTTSRDVKDGNAGHITREPEQVKAFRDTWRDGIHSYLTYLRDRLTVARDLLTDSGSIFVQIGDENLSRVRVLMDEVFGASNFLSLITFVKTGGQTDNKLAGVADYIVWYAKSSEAVKFRQLYKEKVVGAEGGSKYTDLQLVDGRRVPLKSVGETVPDHARIFRRDVITSQSPGTRYDVPYEGKVYRPEPGYWKTDETRMLNLLRARRVEPSAKKMAYVRFFEDFPVFAVNNVWTDLGGVQSRSDPKVYVVQTGTNAVERCLLMATDPGDLVLDPTCGSGTTAYVAEQWGRRWITIDTSRVALALARARIMGARYPFYLLADSKDGQAKEAAVTRRGSTGSPQAPSTQPTHGNIRHGFVYERVPHITLKSIANNAEIDVIWEKWQEKLEPLRAALNKSLGQDQQDGQDDLKIKKSNPVHPVNPVKPFQEWEIPREADERWSAEAKKLHAEWWEARIARQREIDASIAAKAEFEYLYDKPYDDKKKVRVAGPFTVESLSPHRMLGVDENDELIDPLTRSVSKGSSAQDFAAMILENLKTAGVQQAHKEDRITFTSLTPWPGQMVCAAGTYQEGETERRAAIFIGPEFGTVQRQDLVQAAREAGDADFDVLITCGFNYEAHATDFKNLGRIPVLKARMNADLHMAEDLKNTGKGNLFVIFGEPDIEILPSPAGRGAGGEGDDQIQVKVNGVDVFHPNTGEVRSDGAEGIACWFIDTDYNDESFFVRHAYFLGQNDPYSALRTTLKAEINAEAWETLHSDTSRPFDKPKSGKIAVKVINHLGDEVMKVFRV